MFPHEELRNGDGRARHQPGTGPPGDRPPRRHSGGSRPGLQATMVTMTVPGLQRGMRVDWGRSPEAEVETPGAGAGRDRGGGTSRISHRGRRKAQDGVVSPGGRGAGKPGDGSRSESPESSPTTRGHVHRVGSGAMWEPRGHQETEATQCRAEGGGGEAVSGAAAGASASAPPCTGGQRAAGA